MSALAIVPQSAEMLLEQGEALLERRDLLEAIACLNGAEQAGADPNRCAAGRWFCWMLLGRLEQAWMESDAIRGREGEAGGLADVSALAGRRVMLRSLHGFGDAVQFLRYAPKVRGLAERLIVEVAPPFLSLARCFPGIDEVISWGEAAPAVEPKWDVQMEVMELPHLFRSTLADLPEPSCITLPKELLLKASEILTTKAKARVGLVWSGGRWDRSRSVPFREIRELLMRSECVEFWSLQAEEDNADWYGYCSQCGWEKQQYCARSVASLAAFLAQMDLVITIDTLAAHLAGSLGKPVWVMLKQCADWRWMVDRGDSPWYPTMRLFRQEYEGDWRGVIASVRGALDRWSEVR